MKLISKNIVTAILIFFLLTALYSFFAEYRAKEKIAPLSELALQIKEGRVEKIEINGSRLNITLKNGEKEVSKKEIESSFTETMANYGVAEDVLGGVAVEIKEETGFWYWSGIIFPILAPFLIIIFFFWLISRQVKSTSFQALSFGRSKARVIMPDDKKEKTTFND